MLYIVALSAVALLSIGAQWLIQQQLTRGEGDSRIVNIAGRQRMLSQRLTKAALQLNAENAEPHPEDMQELEDTLLEWETNHTGLQTTEPQGLLHEMNSQEVQKLFASIRPHFEAMQQAATHIVDQTAPVSDISQPVAVIEQHEGPFLEGMDRVVSQYVEEAEAKVTRLRRLEYTLLLLTLTILATEGLLIFRPAVRRIENAVEHLATLSERLRTARDQAERANAAKTRFLANVSHELRTPMTAVLGMTELARTADDEAKRQEHLAIIEEAGTSLLGLLNDLIDLAAIDANKLKLEVAAFQPARLTRRVVSMMQPAAEAKGLKLVDEKSTDADLHVMGDERRVQQVLLNLVGNAIKCTPAGSVTVRCLATSADEGQICLTWEVADTGIGIGEDEQKRIFEPFTQLEGDGSKDKKGVGLGLSICRRIADAMQGTFDVTSKVGHGTTIRFSCRFWVAGDPGGDSESPAHLALPPLKLLLVEDTELNQILFRELLEREGHQVVIASSGEEAIEFYERESFDCMLIDLQLPGIDGIETARCLRIIDARLQRTPTPKISITADTLPNNMEVFDAVLTKPITRQRLLAGLHDLLSSTSVPEDTDGKNLVDDSLYHDLANTYLTIAPQQLAEIDGALAQGDLKSASLVVHRLRGQIAYFDSGPIVNELLALENTCARGNFEAVTCDWPNIRDRLQSLCESLQQECSPNA